MRKQYSFWPGATGLDSWDVDHLIVLSRDLPVHDVPLSEIWQLDVQYWDERLTTPRAIALHVELVQQVDPRYPIILAADGRVMDGMHRVVRALLDGRDAVPAVRFREQPPPDHVDCDPERLPYPDPNPGWPLPPA